MHPCHIVTVSLLGRDTACTPLPAHPRLFYVIKCQAQLLKPLDHLGPSDSRDQGVDGLLCGILLFVIVLFIHFLLEPSLSPSS
jgi:hypothetical protein